jgi:hypothetical protein
MTPSSNWSAAKNAACRAKNTISPAACYASPRFDQSNPHGEWAARLTSTSTQSPVFNIDPAAYANGTVRPIAWFADDHPLRSGWAWGQAYLRDGVSRIRRHRRPGQTLCLRARDHLPRPNPRNIQIAIQSTLYDALINNTPGVPPSPPGIPAGAFNLLPVNIIPLFLCRYQY